MLKKITAAAVVVNTGPISIIRVDTKTWENNVQVEKYRSFSYNINGWFVVIEIVCWYQFHHCGLIFNRLYCQTGSEEDFKLRASGLFATTVGIIFKISQVLS